MKLKIFSKFIKIIICLVTSITFVLLVSKFGPTAKIEKNASLDVFTSQLDTNILSLMNDYDIPGVSIALVKNGNIVWKQSYGYANIEKKQKVTTDTVFRVQSISKPITAWGILKLVEEERIELDAPVEQYLKNWTFPNTKYSTDKITIRQLLSHYSGLPLGDIMTIYSPYEEIPSLSESLYDSAYPIQEPGISFSYSNVGYNLLELLIEEVTNKEFSEYMKEEILIPLKMNHSTFKWSEELNPQIATGYNLTGETIPVYVYPEKASGGLFATVEDIANFIIAGMPNYVNEYPVLSPLEISQLYEEEAKNLGMYNLVFDSYGLGYYIENFSNGDVAISHGGQGTGVMTHFHAIPETGDGIVILTNSQRSWPFVSYILTFWAQWCGYSNIGMSKIIEGQYLIWTLIGFVWFTLLLQTWNISKDFLYKKRKLIIFSIKFNMLLMVKLILFLTLTITLLWSIKQDYLFITSVFPVASNWLGITMLITSIILLITIIFPKIEKN